MYMVLYLENMQDRPLGRPRCRWENNMKWDLKWDWSAWTGLIWLRIGTSVGPL